jgi:DNA-directed RNA polymerase specialized sigma24 family protein
MEQSMSSAEAAQVLAISEETVRWRIFKARQILLKQMSAYFDSPELPS